MKLTQRVMVINRDRRSGRLLIRADDPSLTPYAGLAICGELARNLRLVELTDAELQAAGRVAPVKQRRRGLSPGELVVSIAEAQLVGAACFDDIEVLRADDALAPWRAVAQAPSAPTARQLACRFRAGHIHAIERAAARCGNELDRSLGRDPAEAVTFDLDATETVIYGRRKRGAGRSRQGHLAYNSYVVSWAERGRALTSELKGGNQARIKATLSLRMLARAERLLPEGHGQITVRGDNGFYSAELMMGLRKRRMRFTLSATRTSVMWQKLAEIEEEAWVDALDMRGAQVAELAFTPEGWKHDPLRLIVRRVPVTAEELRRGNPKARRRKTIPPEQLQMVLDGQLDSTYAYSFIVTDIPAQEKTTIEVEHLHRQRAQIEERFKDAKLGHALRHLPSRDPNANRLWLCCTLLALNICAWVCDISPAARASGAAPDQRTPLRRHAKTLRHLLFCVPARIVRTARQTIMRLPTGFPHLETFNATYHAALALPGP
ncbi:MAG TPA: IS1380 family transposase [Actinocrinis sp.]|uniref:IS1380 family transposase n=1 Tax=Actinocrinis sp. TaxID=1920516 RepID=UPI002D5A77FC|nr:IS1380 family transposase [Actinocrinis sp.]HZU56325.1 IS1380 family transposase [Actinocrinis sp.]